MDFCRRDSISEVEEIKFNMLLLLRNRFPNGLEGKMVSDTYRKFFNKELNTELFNPQLMGDEIILFSMDTKLCFKAKTACSDEDMLFLSHAVSALTHVTQSNYVYIKGELTSEKTIFYDESMEDDQLDQSPEGNTSDNSESREQTDPLEGEGESYSLDETALVKLDSPTVHEDDNAIDVEIEVPGTPQSSGVFGTKDPEESMDDDDDQERKLNSNSPVEVEIMKSESFDLPIRFFIPSQNSTVIATVRNSFRHTSMGSMGYPGSTNYIVKSSVTEQENNSENEPRIKMICGFKGCGKFFGSAEPLKTHQETLHINDVREPNTPDFFQCTSKECRKIFHDMKSQVHTIQCPYNPFKCFDCPSGIKTFTESRHLASHNQNCHKYDYKEVKEKMNEL